jgi:hypothetical protein
MPDKTVPYNVLSLRLAEIYYRAGMTKNAKANNATSGISEINKANAIVSRLSTIFEDNLNYYFSLKGDYRKSLDRETQQGMAVMQELLRMAKQANQTTIVNNLEAKFKVLQDAYSKSQM